MNYENIFEASVEIICDLKDFDEDEVKGDMTFEQLDLDSMDFIELQVVFRKKFGVNMESEVFADGKVSTIDEMCHYVLELRQAA